MGLVLVVTGYSSLSAIVTAIVAPLFTWWIKPQFTMPVAMLSCLILFRHYDNIRRLLEGEEKPVLLRWWRRER
ncbi:glycerol-3-phosphate acyltransferase [Salinivibrio socompensis]|uniref:glycerol-3-phosphate acyltransferase n=1 Tax=Salinivibrio socompensis TaxID=1510206 RepID=UPI003B8312F2